MEDGRKTGSKELWQRGINNKKKDNKGKMKGNWETRIKSRELRNMDVSKIENSLEEKKREEVFWINEEKDESKTVWKKKNKKGVINEYIRKDQRRKEKRRKIWNK